MGWEGEGGDMGNCPLLIFHASFFLFGWRGWVVKGDSSQVPDMFLFKEFPRAPHF